ncbi:hypothetical protein [Rhodococcus globerulus]|uniref:Head-to-tail stopper n=1 Tax=Rhodococcus globerulus TaxID=33008 RepID=A0ABU4BS81_RHOGO|nr:hypothetical protein [Rhodococcus globerulus]MDV6267073.1 hypothetical protein [Rhodococcus globerulus]
MTIQRVRISPGGFDDYENPIPSDEVRSPIKYLEIAPGATAEYRDLGRNGETIAWTVFVPLTVDLTNDDLLEIDGVDYGIRIQQWKSRRTKRGGLVVLASRTTG